MYMHNVLHTGIDKSFVPLTWLFREHQVAEYRVVSFTSSGFCTNTQRHSQYKDPLRWQVLHLKAVGNYRFLNYYIL